MGNEISTPALIVGNASKAPIKFSLSTEILFEILAFVKFYEAPNIFLVNRYLLPICQVYFHSGTVGHNKCRNVRDLRMQLMKGQYTIFVNHNGTWQSVPVPEVDPPKIFKAFGNIKIANCCRIQAIQFFYKFPSLLTRENNEIICWRDFFTKSANAHDNEKQIDSNSPSSGVVVDEKQLFLNWIGQKKIPLKLQFDTSSAWIACCLENVPLIAQFNGRLFMEFRNKRNLCQWEEEAELIYGWISSSSGTRHLNIQHYDAKKARDLVCQIALLFEQAHINKKEAKKMYLVILLPANTVMPMHEQKVCNRFGEQLATLCTFAAKCSDEYETSAYVFYTKAMEYYYENKKVIELFHRNAVYFL